MYFILHFLSTIYKYKSSIVLSFLYTITFILTSLKSEELILQLAAAPILFFLFFYLFIGIQQIFDYLEGLIEVDIVKKVILLLNNLKSEDKDIVEEVNNKTILVKSKLTKEEMRKVNKIRRQYTFKHLLLVSLLGFVYGVVFAFPIGVLIKNNQMFNIIYLVVFFLVIIEISVLFKLFSSQEIVKEFFIRGTKQKYLDKVDKLINEYQNKFIKSKTEGE